MKNEEFEKIVLEKLTNNKFIAEAGTYTITVKVTDEAGNTQTATITITVENGENVTKHDIVNIVNVSYGENILKQKEPQPKALKKRFLLSLCF